MKTPILGSSYVARSTNAADNVMTNLYPEMIPEGGKEPAYLTKRPGTENWGVVEVAGNITANPIRGMISTYDLSAANTPPVLYVVAGGRLWTTRGRYAYTDLGAIAGSGLVSMASSGTEVFIATDLGTSYIVTIATGTLTQITDADFPGARCVTYLDGYFVFCNQTDQKVWCTDLLNGLSINPLNFASAESSPDPVIAVAASNGELWVFGAQSTEVWANNGNAGFPFAPIQGVTLNVGCLSWQTIVRLNNTLFWFGKDYNGSCSVFRANGYSPERISNYAVEWQIQQTFVPSIPNYSNPEALPYAFGYNQGGHSFYCLGLDSVPSAGGDQWVYDTSTDAWHKRNYITSVIRCQASYAPSGFANTDNETVIFGDNKNNIIMFFNPDAYVDYDSRAITWTRSWRALATGINNLKRTSHHSLQIDCEVGPSDSGTITLRWSDDGGHTWSSNHSITLEGSYSQRLIWRRLGMTMKLRDRVYELSSNSSFKVAITGAELIVSPTDA